MASRRRSRFRNLTSTITDVQSRLRYLEARPSYSRLASQAVQALNIQPKAVSTDQLANLSVVNKILDDDSVTERNLSVDAVTTPSISNGAITTETIADSNITTDKLSDGAVTTSKIADGAVTSEKIGDGEVKTSDIADSNVTTAKINSLAVTTDKINNSAVTTDKIASLNVTTDKLAFGSVITEKIGAGQVSTDNIGQGQVRTFNIDFASITRPKLAVSAVGVVELGNNSVATEKIQGGAVTNGKLAGGISRDKLGFSVALESHTHSQYALTSHGHSGVTNFAGVQLHAHTWSTSTRALKTDISDYKIDTSKLLNLELKKFKYKNSEKDLTKNSEWEFGYMAEDLYELGITEPLAYDSDGNPNRVDYSLIGVLAVELLKNQEKRISKLEEELAALRKDGNDD